MSGALIAPAKLTATIASCSVRIFIFILFMNSLFPSHRLVGGRKRQRKALRRFCRTLLSPAANPMLRDVHCESLKYSVPGRAGRANSADYGWFVSSFTDDDLGTRDPPNPGAASSLERR
jgi:hypothetical protein